jgi:hypothetical protein
MQKQFQGLKRFLFLKNTENLKNHLLAINSNLFLTINNLNMRPKHHNDHFNGVRWFDESIINTNNAFYFQFNSNNAQNIKTYWDWMH